MLLAPGPIVAGSIALSRITRSERPAPPAVNEVVVRGQAPEAKPATSSPATIWPIDVRLSAACAARGEQLESLLGADCHVLVAAPFVIAGDLAPEVLREWHSQTIQPAAHAMAERYFSIPPSEPITVLLWSSKDSYEAYSDKLFRDRGISIYGYYKPRERTLVMNISTGAGTLVHELTHALIAFDCPDVPDWFNEGFASLHEQCRFREDEQGPWIEGLINWRLARLQDELAQKRLPSLEDFVRDDDFRNEREAVNYAQARYLCLYLQERGMLETYYATLRKHIETDRTGAKTLLAIFPEHSWQTLNNDYQQFVRQLPPVK